MAEYTRFRHEPGQLLRHVEVLPLLDTRFVVSWEGEYLFDAFLQGPDVPSLHNPEPVALTTTTVIVKAET